MLMKHAYVEVSNDALADNALVVNLHSPHFRTIQRLGRGCYRLTFVNPTNDNLYCVGGSVESDGAAFMTVITKRTTSVTVKLIEVPVGKVAWTKVDRCFNLFVFEKEGE